MVCRILLPLLAWCTVAMGGGASHAAIVDGGGAKATDCLGVFDVPGANKPAPPRAPRRVDCVDGDPTCDADGERNGRCEFDVRLCVNSSATSNCQPGETRSLTIAHAEDDGDPRFDPDFQALQLRADLFDLPDDTPDLCTLNSAISVVLKGPTPRGKMRRNRKRVVMTTVGTVAVGQARDLDSMRFTCRPEGDRRYRARDLYAGTFDRIAQQIFAPRCAISACHDSESSQNNLELLPNSAYAQLVGIAPHNPLAAAGGLLRVLPGDPDASYLYRKITFALEPGWGDGMPLTGPPLSADLIELIRAWIVGDALLGPAPESGWVEGTDQ